MNMSRTDRESDICATLNSFNDNYLYKMPAVKIQQAFYVKCCRLGGCVLLARDYWNQSDDIADDCYTRNCHEYVGP